MPVLPNVGRKRLKIRLVIWSIYVILTFGGITMVIPYLITLTCSVSNRYDLEKYHPFPTYVWDDEELYCKYLFEKYTFREIRDFNGLVHLTTEREMRMAKDVVEDFFPFVAKYKQDVDVPSVERIREDYEQFVREYPADRFLPNFRVLFEERHRAWLHQTYLRRADEQGLLETAQDPDEIALQLMNRLNGQIIATEFALVGLPPEISSSPKAFYEDSQRQKDYEQFMSELDSTW